MKKRLDIAIAVLGYTLALLSGAAHAADKPIRLVIFAAGGPVDFVARQFAERLTKATGTDVIVEAKPAPMALLPLRTLFQVKLTGPHFSFQARGSLRSHRFFKNSRSILIVI